MSGPERRGESPVISGLRGALVFSGLRGSLAISAETAPRPGSSTARPFSLLSHSAFVQFVGEYVLGQVGGVLPWRPFPPDSPVVRTLRELCLSFVNAVNRKASS